MSYADDLAAAIRQTAGAIGANPLDLATVISYETAGTFGQAKAGPRTKWGQHRGLIQWGEPQAQQYGVDFGGPVADQVSKAGRYLVDKGFRPGMGRLDMYAAVNAGGVGKYNARDAAAGGAPGTVRDKVMNQMGGHEKKAAALLGGSYTPSTPSMVASKGASGTAAPSAPVQPSSPASAVVPAILDTSSKQPTAIEQMIAALAQPSDAPPPLPTPSFAQQPQGPSLAAYLAALQQSAA